MRAGLAGSILVAFGSILLAGCTATPMVPPPLSGIEKICSDNRDKRAWQVAEAPADAGAMRMLAKRHPELPEYVRPQQEFWLSAPSGEIIYCHAGPEPNCGSESEWWEFRRTQSGFELIDQSFRYCILVTATDRVMGRPLS